MPGIDKEQLSSQKQTTCMPTIKIEYMSLADYSGLIPKLLSYYTRELTKKSTH